MTLPVSGAISFNAINVELGVAGTTTANINQASYRNLAGVPSGTISLSNFYGKSSTFNLTKTISSSTQNYNLLADMQANGFTNGSAFTVNLTIGSGVYIWTDTTATAAFDTGAISGTGTITITNNGFIMGKGGQGGGLTPSATGTAGGPAINLQRSVTINNTNGSAYIGGGGGGGGGVASLNGSQSAGGGAGGGQGGNSNNAGGAGGSIGASGSTGNSSGGGGGRIFPGSGGASVNRTGTGSTSGNGGGAGGGGSVSQSVFKATYSAAGGGGGGGWGASGGGGVGRGGSSPINITSGAGGSSNGVGDTAVGVGGSGGSTQAGSAGGKAVNLNGNSVTWTSGDTTRVYGAVS
jgi:hypothetical protein